ncbi:unnamed protein product [Closterium sp. Naga37s-1]|nr:unnamed protein product [Closterium sp. Naga37s-1]
MAQAALTALDTWTARDWRKEERRWREELRRWRADDVAFRAEERRFKAEERMFRAVRHRWRDEIMQQRHVDNAMHLWDRVEGKAERLYQHLKAIAWHQHLTPRCSSSFLNSLSPHSLSPHSLSPHSLSPHSLSPSSPATGTGTEEECNWRSVEEAAERSTREPWSGTPTPHPLLVANPPFFHSLRANPLRAISPPPLTSTKECNRRSVEEKAEHMRAMAWVAAIVGGFTMTAPVEFTYSDPDAPMALVTAYALCTALVPSLMVVAAMIAVFVLGAVLRMGKLYVHEREEEEFLASARYFALNRAAAGGNRTTITAPPASLRSFDRFWDLRPQVFRYKTSASPCHTPKFTFPPIHPSSSPPRTPLAPPVQESHSSSLSSLPWREFHPPRS